MNELSLFTGAGGGVLGSKILGWEAVGYVEWDKYCQEILAQRIQDGFLNEAPIFGDIDVFIKSGAARKYEGFVDVVTAGFPCQPFSVAGKKRGQDDERNKWPQTLECIRLIRPRYALLENVPGLLNSGYFGEILSSLAQIGFDARWTVLGADDVGAPHRRKRLWILAYPHGERQLQPEGFEQDKRGWSSDSGEDVQDPERSGRLHREHEEERIQLREQRESRPRGGERVSGDSPEVADSIGVRHGRRSAVGSGRKDAIGRIHPSEKGQTGQHVWSEAVGRGSVRGQEDVADSEETGLQGRLQDREFGPQGRQVEGDGCPSERGLEWERIGDLQWWITEPDVGRVAHGVASRVDRLKALGNGQVPAVAATAWLLLTK
jgi:DNA (cytosine-5)-methyltransferase 1